MYYKNQHALSKNRLIFPTNDYLFFRSVECPYFQFNPRTPSATSYKMDVKMDVAVLFLIISFFLEMNNCNI